MRLLISALLLTTVACGTDSPSAPTNATMAGIWSLVTVDGAQLPFTLVPGSAKTELFSRVLTLTANGTFTGITSTRTTVNGQVATDFDNYSGTYAISGRTVTFQSADGYNGSGTVTDGDKLTALESGHLYVYKKS